MRKWKKALAVLGMILLLPLLAMMAQADIVTDTLTVKVGYYGMDPSEYVELGTYQWWQLEEDLPQYQQAYSFYKGEQDGVIRTVVDAAYGFYLTDLLDYAGIYQGDVQSMSFYTRDHAGGSFTSFTARELFGGDRYYFENLGMHLQPIYSENGRLEIIDDSEAWDYATVVQPMLALEDNWATFEISSYETPPNFDAMGAGNRFRLLFGQTAPTRTQTNQSAKYVHAVYVTLGGSAIYTPEPPVLDATIGSHTVTARMTVSNEGLLGALQGLLNFTPVDGTVVRIKGWSVKRDASASDLVLVEISYEVLKEGEVGIIGTVGSSTAGQVFAAGSAPKPGPTPDAPEEPYEPGGNNTGGGHKDLGEAITRNDGLPGMDITFSDADGEWGMTEPAEPGQESGERIIPLSAEVVAQLRAAQAAAEKSDDTNGDQSGADRTALEVPIPEKDWTYTWVTAGLLLITLGLGALYAGLSYKKERGTMR